MSPQHFNDFSDPKLIDIIKNGVAVIPTDTLYGVVTSVDNNEAIARITQMKSRPPHKSYIVLISDLAQLQQFWVPEHQLVHTVNYWPGPYSLIMHVNQQYAHLGHEGVAFRLPKNPDLINLINKTGPIIAPSANPTDQPPATNIDQAIYYFSDAVDAYVNGGELDGKPSTVIKIHTDGSLETLRE